MSTALPSDDIPNPKYQPKPRFRRVQRDVALKYMPLHVGQKAIDHVASWWNLGGQSVGRILAAINRIRKADRKANSKHIGTEDLIYADIYAILLTLLQSNIVTDRPSGYQHPGSNGLIEMNIEEFKVFYRAWKSGMERSDCYRMTLLPTYRRYYPEGALEDGFPPKQFKLPNGNPPPIPCSQSCFNRVFKSLSLRWIGSKTKQGRPLTTTEKMHKELLDIAHFRTIDSIYEGEVPQAGQPKDRSALVIFLDEIPEHLYRTAWNLGELPHLLSREVLVATENIPILQKVDKDTANLSSGNYDPVEAEKRELRKRILEGEVEDLHRRMEIVASDPRTLVKASEVKLESSEDSTDESTDGSPELPPLMEGTRELLHSEDGAIQSLEMEGEDILFDEPDFESMTPKQIEEKIDEKMKESQEE